MTGISAIRTISFTGKENSTNFTGKTDEEKREAAKKVVEGGGASALVAKGAMSKARKGGLDMFASKNITHIGKETKDAIQATSNMTDAIKLAKAPITKSKSLWGICKRNAKSITSDIMKWADRMKKSKFLKPLLESKLFMGFAGALGFVFGFMTLASGITDIASMTTDIYSKKFVEEDKDKKSKD